MKEQEDRNLTRPEHDLTNEPGSVGEEQLPAGIEKTDKQEWTYSGRSRRKDSVWKRITDWGTKGWGG